MMQGPGEMRVLMAVWAQALKQRPVQPPGAAGRGDGEFVEISGGLGSL